MELSRQVYWSGQFFPSPGDLPNPGIEPGSPPLRPDSLLSEPAGKPRTSAKDLLVPLVEKESVSEVPSTWLVGEIKYRIVSGPRGY